MAGTDPSPYGSFDAPGDGAQTPADEAPETGGGAAGTGAAGTGEGAAMHADPLSFLKEELDRAEAERDESKDKMLRALAEAENVRRRAARDREEAEKFGGTKLARDLLSVHDNLARAMEAAGEGVREAAPDFVEGIELTQRELLNAFAKHGIEAVSPALGDRFDPALHQAMFEAPVPGAEPGTVIQVVQQGFTISDRLLRPAMVGVAKAAPSQAAPAADPQPGEGDAPDAA